MKRDLKSKSVRAPLVFAAGLILAAGSATLLDGASAAIARAFEGKVDLSKAALELAKPGPLSLAEEQAALAAWRYFERNTQAQTGFVNSVADFPSATLWDQGTYLLALVSAARLELITQEVFDARVLAFIDGLARIELFDQRLPNKVYHTQTLSMVTYSNELAEEGIGWSALDIARLLMGLRVVEKHYPEHGSRIRQVLSEWDLDAMAKGGELIGAEREVDGDIVHVQEGRIGYEQYGARSAALWGLDVIRAMSAERVVSWQEVEGIDVPVDRRRASSFGAITPTLSEPYLLLALELGLDSESYALAHRVYAAQESRYRSTGQITAVSEDHLDRAPFFAYSSVSTNGRDWGVVTELGTFHDDLRTISTKAAFGWAAVFDTDYAELAREAVIDLAQDQGFPAGVYEADGKVNEAFTLNTNGVILEALHYQAFGPLWTLR